MKTNKKARYGNNRRLAIACHIKLNQKTDIRRYRNKNRENLENSTGL
jgi:hypothetical protein